jgi:hypothetical protein
VADFCLQSEVCEGGALVEEVRGREGTEGSGEKTKENCPLIDRGRSLDCERQLTPKSC